MLICTLDEKESYLACVSVSQHFLNPLTLDNQQSKTLSTIDQPESKIPRNSVFNCHDKWQTKALFLTIFDLHLIVNKVFNLFHYCLSGVLIEYVQRYVLFCSVQKNYRWSDLNDNIMVSMHVDCFCHKQ